MFSEDAKETVLVVSAHPDDEAFGCGGTLLRHVKAGHPVHWVVVTRPWLPKWDDAYLERAARQVAAAAAAYGVAGWRRLDFPAAALDTVPLAEVVDAISEVVREVQPTVVYTVGPYDVNSDHDVVYRAVMIALKPLYAPSVRRVLTFETPSSTDWAFAQPGRTFLPQVYVDISDTLEEKIRICSLYETETQPFPHPRSAEAVRALAMCRGAAAGFDYAEAFQVQRMRVP